MKKLIVFAFLFWSVVSFATCSGSGTTWSCTAGSTVSQVQTAINSASDGFTLTLANGSYTLGSWIKFSNSVGGTIICASVGGCTINFTTNQVFGGDLFGGTNTHFYRISGFVFDGGGSCAPTGVIWFDNANGSSPVVMNGSGLGGIRIDHNTFQNCNTGAIDIFFGHNNGSPSPIGNYYGVIDHNTWAPASGTRAQWTPLEYIGIANPSPPSNQLGTEHNMFFENNTLSFASMASASNGGCTDSWGGAAYVVRHNTSNDCLWTTHGATHAGGPANYEFYNNTVVLDSSATGESPIDCYRCYHHQGSGTFVGFNNTFTTPSTYNSEIISMANYRGYANGPSIDAGIVACDGSVTNQSYDSLTFSDGNRAPSGSNYGYPCWHQPGRDFAGNYAPMYVWNNTTGASAQVNLVNPDFGGTVPNGSYPPNNCTTGSSGNCDYNSFQMVANREWYNAVSASAQSNSTTPFNGTTGMGFGTLANRPTTCTTNSTESGAGVGYFATDQGTQGVLYTCSATNTWTIYYKPYTYPHPLVASLGYSPGSLTFAPQPVSTTSSGSTITITNNGGSTITMTSEALQTGTNFSVSSNTCGGSLTSGANCVVTITFTPTTYNNLTDDLVVTSSDVNSPVYIAVSGIGLATPVISPATGSYSGLQTVTITDSTTSVTMYYTLDGSTPDNTKTLYSGSFQIATTTTVKAIAYLSGVASGVNTSVITITGTNNNITTTLQKATLTGNVSGVQ